MPKKFIPPATYAGCKACLEKYVSEITELEAEVERLKIYEALEDNSWDLRGVDEPTGGGDFDIAWNVIEHYMAEPRERKIGYGRTPVEAIKEALKSENSNLKTAKRRKIINSK